MFNRIVLMGRITHDLELRITTNGEAYLSFQIAVDRDYSKDAEKQTDFFNCIAFRKTAEHIHNYFGKGRMILVEGRLQNDNYVDKNGQNVKAMKIIVDRVTFTGEKKDQDASQQAYQSPSQNYQPQMYPQQANLVPPPQNYQQQQMQQAISQPVQPQGVQVSSTDDDYPF